MSRRNGIGTPVAPEELAPAVDAMYHATRQARGVVRSLESLFGPVVALPIDRALTALDDAEDRVENGVTSLRRELDNAVDAFKHADEQLQQIGELVDVEQQRRQLTWSQRDDFTVVDAVRAMMADRERIYGAWNAKDQQYRNMLAERTNAEAAEREVWYAAAERRSGASAATRLLHKALAAYNAARRGATSDDE